MGNESVQPLTDALEYAKSGDRRALDALMQTMYDDLRRLAGHYMQDERAGHTFQPTALVHEAFVRLLDQQQVSWRDRGQFLALASRMMRRVLVDHARGRQAAKRGGSEARHRLSVEGVDPETPGSQASDVDLVALDEALERLDAISPTQARMVELRFFGGLSIEEAAEAMEIGKRSADREWAGAKAWLYRELSQ